MHHMTTSNSMAQCNTFWIFQAHAGVISTADIEGIVNHWTDRMDISEPSDFALLIVQQYLKERGYEKAILETEKAHGLKFVESKLPRGSMLMQKSGLMQLVYEAMEKEAALSDDDDSAEQKEEEERLLQGGSDTYPCEERACIAGMHSSSITAIRYCPEQEKLVTGSGDGSVQAFKLSGEQCWACRRTGAGGAISLDVSSIAGNGRSFLLAGFMDGSVTVLDVSSGDELAKLKLHSKYVVRALWSPDGRHIVSSSWDGSIAISEFDDQGDEEASISLVETLPFPTAVQDVIFLPGGDRIMLALRDTNLLRIRNYPDIKAGDEKINLNALKDNHISFSARQLALSPCAKYLAVSTDSARIILLRIKGWKHLGSQIVGLPLDTFHNSVARWDRSSYYLMAAAAAGHVYTFHVGTGKVVAKLKAHEQNVRWLDYDPEHNLLFTCSFDRTVKIYHAAQC